MRFLFAIISATVALCVCAHAAERPNVLLICVDDLKPMLGCYGDATAKSPNIDRLAERGMRFERAYCNQAVCAPSRNALLTGLRPQTLGIYDLGTNFRRAAPDAVTLPQHFKSHGYRAEGMGKIFHQGHGNGDDAASWSVPYWRADVVRYAKKDGGKSNELTREEALFANVPARRANQLPKGPAYESADVSDSAYPDGQVADEAIRRLEQAAKSPDQLFFLAVGFVKPHLPFCAPKKYWDMYDRDSFTIADRQTPPEGAPEFAPTSWGELRNYSNVPDKGELSEKLQRTLIHGYHAATSYMDAQVGRVLDALDKTGLAKNTIIVFWGDHGWHLGDHGMWCKHTNYEQAARIPILIVTPDGEKSQVSQALVESVDIYPTLCELAGLPIPEGLDGKSLKDVLEGSATDVDGAAIHVYPRGQRIGRAVRTDRYRLVEWKVPGASKDSAILELYDYEQDPGETKNVADDEPEVVAKLRKILDREPEAKPQLKKKAAAARVPRPKNIVSREEWGSQGDPIPDSRKHTPKYITIHHAGVLWTNTVEPAQFVRNMQSWGKRRPEIEPPPRNTYWPDLAYHFMIAPDGKIYEARPLKYEPESNTKYDLAGNLGIELMGDFNQQRPSKAQLESAVRLTAWLASKYDIGIDDIRTHRDAAPDQTSCPGRDFYRYFENGQFKKWVNRVQNGQPLNINPGPPLKDPAGPTELVTDTRKPAK